MNKTKTCVETEFILSTPGAYKMIKKGKRQARKRQGVILVEKILGGRKG